MRRHDRNTILYHGISRFFQKLLFSICPRGLTSWVERLLLARCAKDFRPLVKPSLQLPPVDSELGCRPMLGLEFIKVFYNSPLE